MTARCLENIHPPSIPPDIQEVMVTPIALYLEGHNPVYGRCVIWVWRTILFHNYTTK